MASLFSPVPLVLLVALIGLASCKTEMTATSVAPAAPQALSLSTAMDLEAASRGRAIAIVGCASCHAIDTTGVSPFAPATPFRDIVRRRSLEDLETAFSSGLVTTHPAMPPYVFRASEIDDLIAYLDTLSGPQKQ